MALLRKFIIEAAFTRYFHGAIPQIHNYGSFYPLLPWRHSANSSLRQLLSATPMALLRKFIIEAASTRYAHGAIPQIHH